MSSNTSKTKPLVSIITPVYNAERFLPRLFECVRNQLDVEVEHILVDDCSSDKSLKIMRDYAVGNSSVKIIALEKNSGPVVARNMAIREARGKYLAFLDADDYWFPNKSLVQSQFMDETGATLSFSDYRFISEDGRLIGRRLSGSNSVGFASHHMTRYLGCLTIMINRELCPDFYFPDISPSYRAEDFLAWSGIILRHGPALRCKHDLARYAVVANSRSSGAFRAAKSVWLLYRYVEKIPVITALFYFAVYAVLTTLKRSRFKPKWAAGSVDGKLADAYLLKPFVGLTNDH
jgi:teichuronic acid biosynthesis glycosyltransferase TuaG